MTLNTARRAKKQQNKALPDVGELYKGYAKEDEEDAVPPIDEAEARAAALQPGPTPDEVPLDAEYVTHPPAGLGTSFVEKPKPGSY